MEKDINVIPNSNSSITDLLLEKTNDILSLLILNLDDNPDKNSPNKGIINYRHDPNRFSNIKKLTKRDNIINVLVKTAYVSAILGAGYIIANEIYKAI
jgi:hypothetical protein